MAEYAAIQWCDTTCNPTMGCDGCELWNSKDKTCYAGKMNRRFPRNKGFSSTFEQVTLHPGRMAKAAKYRDLTGAARSEKPWLNGLPRLIFVSDMSDALSALVPFEYLEDEIVHVANSPNGKRHQWLWLSKRPNRMAEFSAMLAAKSVVHKKAARRNGARSSSRFIYFAIRFSCFFRSAKRLRNREPSPEYFLLPIAFCEITP